MQGKTLGAFQIGPLLGEGGMGKVYKARDTKLKRDVALKFLRDVPAIDGEKRARFEREATLLAALNHPNIATIYGLEDAPGVRFLVLEFVRGTNLSERIAEAPVGVAEALRIGRQIADALEAAHENGILHRDLKPSNVMLTPRGRVKVLDFGLAVPFNPFGGERVSEPAVGPRARLTKQGTLLGTPEYMSPEQFDEQPLDERSDIWAFGCVLYETLSGQTAFGGGTVPTVLARIIEDDPDWGALPEGTPESIRSLLEICLRKDRKLRLKDAADLRIEIDRALSQLTPGPVATSALDTLERRRPSIAVLPFVNMSGEPEDEYFGHGLAEELIHGLSRVQGIRVAARTSSFGFAHKHEDVREIGRQLDVESILEGSVRKAEGRIRVTAQLIDVSDGLQLTSQRFDCDTKDIFAIQDEIARAIVEKLEVELAGKGREPLIGRHTDSVEAQTLYMQGRFYWARRHEIGLRTSMERFREAIAIDPTHAGAHAGLANAYWSIGQYMIQPPKEVFPKANESAMTALRLDERLADAHTALAMIRFVFDWDWIGAEREFRRAIDLNPNSPLPHGYYAVMLALLGRADEALEEAKKNRALDPFSSSAHGVAAMTFCLTGRYEEAIQACEHGLAVEPGSYGDKWVLAWAYDRSGRPEEALQVLADLSTHFGRRGILLPMLGHAFAASGKQDDAREILAQMQAVAAEAYVPAAHFGWIYGGLNERDKANEWMEKAFDERSNPVCFAFYNRFDHLLRRMDLPATI